MKRRCTALLLVCLLLLSGCTPLFRRSYYSASDHVDYSVEEDSSVLRAESYRGLVDAMLYFVNEHFTRGVVRLYNYTGDVDGDLAAACREIMEEDPLTAYAVEDIRYEYARIVSYYEVTVTVAFAHTQAEIDAIRSVPASAAIRPLLDEAVTSFAPSLTFRVSYFSGDEESLRDLLTRAYYAAPQCAFGMPSADIRFYPESGAQRIVDITFTWPGDKKTLEMRSAERIAAADRFLAQTPPGDEGYTPAALAEAFRLTADPADLAARTAELQLILHRAGLAATYVSGFAGETEFPWLIVETGEGYSHLLWSGESVRLLSDGEMTDLGYLWRTDLVPACAGVPAVAEPEGGETAAPTDE